MTDIRLEFDGTTLQAVNTNTGTVMDSWDAISGRPGSQSANLSNIPDTGPIPTGNWSISTSNVINMDDLPLWRQVVSETGLVSPRGGVSSWGDTFVRIEAADGTETYGRDGFHLHGGAQAGSAGCIDLVGGNDAFFEFIQNYDGQIELVVDYSGNEAILSGSNHPLLQSNEPRTDTPLNDAAAFEMLERLYNGDVEATQWFITQFPGCFGPEVPIDMWPLHPDFAPDPSNPNKIFDQDAVRAKVWKKPIELIRVGDIVVSFDDNDNLVPGPVTETFQHDAKILLNFHGTRVTPGHVYYRPDSKKSYKYETLIDVLRDDGVIKHQDGTLIRAATNAPVDSPRDGFVRAVAGKRKADGTFVQTDEGRIRLGTRFVVGTGEERKSFAVADLIERNGGVVGADELIHVSDNPGVPFTWDFADTLPKPEDFVLACSGTTLEDIYKAAEWESQGPRLPAPTVLDRGPVQPLKGAALSAMPRNEPLHVAHGGMASAKPQRTLNRKQRKAMEAKQRKAAKACKQMAG
jgi:hypothetical protein